MPVLVFHLSTSRRGDALEIRRKEVEMHLRQLGVFATLHDGDVIYLVDQGTPTTTNQQHPEQGKAQ